MTAKPGSRTVPISGRVAEEDYAFLMAHGAGGMVTASEKLRHLCAFFRWYHESREDFEGCLEELRGWLRPVRAKLLKAELDEGMRSEFLETLNAALPRLMALLASAQIAGERGAKRKSLLELEERLLGQTLNLLENVLRLGVTTQAPTYNPGILKKRLETLSELIEILKTKS